MITSMVRNLIARRVVKSILNHVATFGEGSLVVQFDNGERQTFGLPGQPPTAHIHIKSPEFYMRILRHGDVGFGEAYMDGLWWSEDLAALCCFGLNHRKLAPGWVLKINELGRKSTRAWHLGRRNTKSGSRENISAHYDLSNDLFRLFLDETMTYSCAIFESPEETLEEAQRNKYDALCRKASIGPDDHVLEIGSGWGGFAIHAAKKYGCRVTSVTVSQEQLELARQRVAEAGLSDRVKIEFCDYRDIRGTFDKIVSIEMFEAVGYEYFTTFFEKCDEVLRPGGCMALQVITVPDRDFLQLLNSAIWIQKYIFPGGMLPSLSELERSLKKTAFSIMEVDNIGINYARTLQLWRAKFISHHTDVLALDGFDERFVRMWEFYLASCEAGFATHSTGDLQVTLEKH